MGVTVSVGEEVGVGLVSGVLVASSGRVGTSVGVRVFGRVGVGMNRMATAVGVVFGLANTREPKDTYTVATPKNKPININPCGAVRRDHFGMRSVTILRIESG